MINRRQFTSLAAALLMGSYPKATNLFASLQAKVVSLDIKDFEFTYSNGKLVLNAKDILIDGLTIPKFTWSWVGLGVAQGLLSGFGAAVFGALNDAIFSNHKKSIEQLIQEVLAEIAQIVADQLVLNDLRNYNAEIQGLGNLFRQYLSIRDPLTLQNLADNTAVPIAKLESIGFTGYRTFMLAAGLRLAVLQEYVSRKRRGAEYFIGQRDALIAHHQSMDDQIELITDPAHVAYRFNGISKWDPQFPQELNKAIGLAPTDAVRGARLHNERFLTETVDGWIFLSHQRVERGQSDAELTLEQVNILAGLAHTTVDKVASLSATRKKLRNDNTALGAKMVDRWKEAKIRFSQRQPARH